MAFFLHDIRYAVRGLLHAPAFASVALITLALGIGANTAMFAILNAVLLRPLPYNASSRIVTLQQTNPAVPGLERTGLSPLEYLDYKERTHAFTHLGGVIVEGKTLTGGGEPERLQIGRVTPDIFEVLGVQPILGRAFREEEDRFGGPPVVILSHSLWRQQFGGDRRIVGKTVQLDNRPYEVIGVMPASFKFPYEGTPFYKPASVWVPMDFTPSDMQNRTHGYDVQAFARMKPGVTLAQAQRDAEAACASLQADHRDIYTGTLRPLARVVLMKSMATAGATTLVWILFGAVAIVLLIACVNVANLLLVRATVRQREVAIRTALGASAARLGRQLMTESVLLAVISGAGGLVIAFAAVRWLAGKGSPQLPRLAEITMDPAVFAYCLCATLMTSLVFGLVPVLRALRVDLQGVLKLNSQQGGAALGTQTWQNILIVVEIAATLVLLLSAGLLINSFVRVLRMPPGFNPTNVTVARTAFDETNYHTQKARNVAKQNLLEKLAALPGVQQVGATTQLPLTDERNIGVHVDGEAPDEFHMIANELVTPTYFSAMGIPLQRGRNFTDQDRPDARLNSAVVSDSFARQFWPGVDPIGKRFSWGGRWPFEIVGVVADVRLSAIDAEPPPTVYMSMLQVEGGSSAQTVFAIRSSTEPATLVSDVRRAIRAVDPGLPVYDVNTMDDVIKESLAKRRFLMSLLAGFATIAILLVTVGLYGVLSYTVTQRSRELGLRMALGATSSELRLFVLLGGLKMVALGMAVGFTSALLVVRVMSKMMFGISTADPATYAAAGGLLLGVALAASYLPARRATNTDPMVVLRCE